MRFNDKALAALSKKDGQFEGRLQYRAPPGSFRDTVFRERFFKLIGNLLFYFRLTEVGTIDFKEPVGVIVLENYTVQPESETDVSFAFGILFLDDPDKKHVFSARTDSDVQLWVNALRQASYQHWKERLHFMQSQLNSLIEAKKAMSALQRMSDELDNVDINARPRPNPFLSPSPRLQPRLPPPIQHSPQHQRRQPKPNDNNDLIQF